MANNKPPIVSLIMLLAQPRALDRDDVERAAECAFEVLFNKAPYQVIPVPDKPLHAVKMPGMTLGVIHHNRPYFNDIASASNATQDFAAKLAIQNHRGWISVDLMGDPSQPDTTEACAAIGKLVAELIGPDPLALACTPSGKIVAYDRCFLQLLRTGNAQEVFKLGSVDRIVDTSPNDPELAAAAIEARRRLPEFVTAFANRRRGQGFGVKKAFREGQEVEHMWINVTQIDGTLFRGKLSNTPNTLRALSLGGPVSATADEIEDWVYTNGPRTIGGFQIAILKNRGGKS